MNFKEETKIESQKRNDRNDEMKDNENNGNNEIKGNNRSRNCR